MSLSAIQLSAAHTVTCTLQEQVESLGPVAGPLIFILTAASVEMVPLFPKQPVMLASGLLFGPVKVSTAAYSL